MSEMTDAQVDAVLGLNVRAVMIEAIEASRHMTKGGRIILIGSALPIARPSPAFRSIRPPRRR